MTMLDLNSPPDLSILNVVLARLIKTDTFAQPLLALEILDGPYKGVTFWFASFHADLEKQADGMTPVSFVTKIYEAPPGFVPDAAFDGFCGEIFFAWLTYINQNDMAPLLKAKPVEGVH